MKRSIALIALIASSAFGGATMTSTPAAAAVTYICTTSADCAACKTMHPESTCQNALARVTGDKVVKFVGPKIARVNSTSTASSTTSVGAKASAVRSDGKK